jgi:hypothetical protein
VEDLVEADRSMEADWKSQSGFDNSARQKEL